VPALRRFFASSAERDPHIPRAPRAERGPRAQRKEPARARALHPRPPSTPQDPKAQTLGRTPGVSRQAPLGHGTRLAEGNAGVEGGLRSRRREALAASHAERPWRGDWLRAYPGRLLLPQVTATTSDRAGSCTPASERHPDRNMPGLPTREAWPIRICASRTWGGARGARVLPRALIPYFSRLRWAARRRPPPSRPRVDRCRGASSRRRPRPSSSPSCDPLA
jgi:hypothetical protein